MVVLAKTPSKLSVESVLARTRLSLDRASYRLQHLTPKEQVYVAAGVASAAVIVAGVIYWRRNVSDDSNDTGSGGESAPAAAAIYSAPQYKPFSPEANDLFLAAAKFAGLPVAWATSMDTHNILAGESQGWVGIPNYQFGSFWGGKNRDQWPAIWASIKNGTWRNMLVEPHRSASQSAQSSATGLGQMTITNLKSGNYYPSGVEGIGHGLEEAIGMLRYIAGHTFDLAAGKVRAGSGTPAEAWAFHQKWNWY